MPLTPFESAATIRSSRGTPTAFVARWNLGTNLPRNAELFNRAGLETVPAFFFDSPADHG
jgi:hypothetical protein